MQRPAPVVTDLTRPFWDGARRHALVIQRCVDCGRFQHPPFLECGGCHSTAFEFVAVAGTGAIVERAVVNAPIVAGWEDAVPFACIVVELDEQPDLWVGGNLVDAPPDQAEVGRRVYAVFEDVDGGWTIPLFRLQNAQSRGNWRAPRDA